MTSPAELFAFLTFTAVSMVCHCKAEVLPPPSNVTYRWMDACTVNVSWQKPRGLPAEDVKYKFKYRLQEPNSLVRFTSSFHFTVDILTGTGNRTYLVWTVRETDDIPEESANVCIKVPESRAQVTDIKCLVVPKNKTHEMNCSWVPGNPNLTLFFSVYGQTKKCERPYGDAVRSGCYLSLPNSDVLKKLIHMVFESDAGLSTFKMKPMIDPPELSIGEEGDNLILNWTRPKIEASWIVEVCYNKCSDAEKCRDYKMGEFTPMSYDKSCRYKFRSKVRTDRYTIPIFSEFGQDVYYGENKPADETLTVVAIVVPIILSVCILLSCYCFRRHSSILCPVIPDPSVIFKEMMMNENKEPKTTTGSLYTPVPEPVESCKVDSVTDSAVVPLNS